MFLLQLEFFFLVGCFQSLLSLGFTFCSLHLLFAMLILIVYLQLSFWFYWFILGFCSFWYILISLSGLISVSLHWCFLLSKNVFIIFPCWIYIYIYIYTIIHMHMYICTRLSTHKLIHTHTSNYWTKCTQ